jgi:hypothetical protein
MLLEVEVAGVTVKALPLQAVAVKACVMAGFGLTIITYRYCAPKQVAPPAIVALAV